MENRSGITLLREPRDLSARHSVFAAADNPNAAAGHRIVTGSIESEMGPALALWDAVSCGDAHAVSLIVETFGAQECGDSTLALLVHLLYQAGHHHVGDHRPRPVGFCRSTLESHLPHVPVGYCLPGTGEDCPCSIRSAFCWALAQEPPAATAAALRALKAQFENIDPLASAPELIRLDATSTLDLLVAVQGVAALVAYRMSIRLSEVKAILRNRVAAVAAVAVA